MVWGAERIPEYKIKTKQMISKRTQKAIDIWLKALEEGKLSKGDCSACAVGNLANGSFRWLYRFCTSNGEQLTDFRPGIFMREADEAIGKTDFDMYELAKIEYAFETNTKIHNTVYYMHTPEQIREDQLKGLRACVEVLLSFDDNSFSIEEEFSSKAELIPLMN